jgi:hypothetical protein
MRLWIEIIIGMVDWFPIAGLEINLFNYPVGLFFGRG